jgi:hypothetical protein
VFYLILLKYEFLRRSSVGENFPFDGLGTEKSIKINRTVNPSHTADHFRDLRPELRVTGHRFTLPLRVMDDVIPLESLNQSWLKRGKVNGEYQELNETYLRRVIKPVISFVMEQPEECAFFSTASYPFLMF